jgi:hypothetical protein
MPVEKENESNQKSRRDDMSVEKTRFRSLKKSRRDDMSVSDDYSNGLNKYKSL